MRLHSTRRVQVKPTTLKAVEAKEKATMTQPLMLRKRVRRLQKKTILQWTRQTSQRREDSLVVYLVDEKKTTKIQKRQMSHHKQLRGYSLITKLKMTMSKVLLPVLVSSQIHRQEALAQILLLEQGLVPHLQEQGHLDPIQQGAALQAPIRLRLVPVHQGHHLAHRQELGVGLGKTL